LGKIIKIVMSDRGGEYCGIVSQYTMPETHEQNGVVKRHTKTLKDMIRSMMNRCNLPEFWWEKALKTTLYILNRIPSKFIPKTPFELWTGRKPSLDHL